MTKAIFTGLYFLESDHKKSLISSIVPWLYDVPTRVNELLSHTSGLKAHKKYYKLLSKSEHWHNDLKKMLRADMNDTVKESGSSSPLSPSFPPSSLFPLSPLYSDIGYLVLYYVIQEIEETKDLKQVFDSLRKKRNLPEGFHFNCENSETCENSENMPFFKKTLYAPTEKCKWRKKIIQGEVFDDNAWAMGGVSTHAGLFGSLSDMIAFYEVLKNVYSNKNFNTVAPGWTNGFMKPSGLKSTAGDFFSKDSIGHLGFTGVSFWFDPKVDFYVTVLSNRTFPNRNDASFNSLRPWIHNLLYKEFVNEHPKPRKI